MAVKTKRLWACDGVIVCERHAGDDLLMVIRQSAPAPAHWVDDHLWLELHDDERKAFHDATGEWLDCDGCA